MLPFCGYNMADYFGHWLAMGDRLGAHRPSMFRVNWFRRSPDGKWLWPGFGENARVLKWMCERVAGRAAAEETPAGRIPAAADLDLQGLDMPAEDLQELLRIDVPAWRQETEGIRAYFERFGERMPGRLIAQLAAQEERLAAAR